MEELVLTITEGERQMLILALAKLSIQRPGWDLALNELALKMDNHHETVQDFGNHLEKRAEMYDEFRKLDLKESPPTVWERLSSETESKIQELTQQRDQARQMVRAAKGRIEAARETLTYIAREEKSPVVDILVGLLEKRLSP